MADSQGICVSAESEECGGVQAIQTPPEGGPVQTKSTAPDGAQESVAPPAIEKVLRSPGQALDPATRAFMEPRFGHDFSRVRVHTDTRAAESARAVNALAYTVGRDVVFGAGKYAPETTSGKQLIA